MNILYAFLQKLYTRVGGTQTGAVEVFEHRNIVFVPIRLCEIDAHIYLRIGVGIYSGRLFGAEILSGKQVVVH